MTISTIAGPNRGERISFLYKDPFLLEDLRMLPTLCLNCSSALIHFSSWPPLTIAIIRTAIMDSLRQLHRAMTTVILFGTKEMPISSVTLADAFRIIDADEFLRRMLHCTRACSWNCDIFSIKADAVFTLDGFPQCIPMPLATAPHRSNVPHHQIWFQTFLRELWTIWEQTPSVVVIRMVVRHWS